MRLPASVRVAMRLPSSCALHRIAGAETHGQEIAVRLADHHRGNGHAAALAGHGQRRAGVAVDDRRDRASGLDVGDLLLESAEPAADERDLAVEIGARSAAAWQASARVPSASSVAGTPSSTSTSAAADGAGAAQGRREGRFLRGEIADRGGRRRDPQDVVEALAGAARGRHREHPRRAARATRWCPRSGPPLPAATTASTPASVAASSASASGSAGPPEVVPTE